MFDADTAVAMLAAYGLAHGLAAREDTDYVINGLLRVMQMDAFHGTREQVISLSEHTDAPPLREILEVLTDDAVSRGVCGGGIVRRDLFDTGLMGVLTPRPSEVNRRFRMRYGVDPARATDWFYGFAQNTDYIRAYRIKKDIRWKYESEYGPLDITINLSKPEKDPEAIAAAARLAKSGYPACQLCRENEGYAGRLDHPARGNLRIIPLELCGESWGFQYSPYVYYNEHCIVLNDRHVPMEISGRTFRLLFDFVSQFPHYFVGSNADLPIVGGSILSHEHFQGGRYTFAMTEAEPEKTLSFDGFDDVQACILKWPMSVVRLAGTEPERICGLAERILDAWRGWSDEEAGILAESGGAEHNTITPIARMREGRYELDLVLRNNRTTPEHPLGLFHPHEDLHHIKKENIGLIEVMGLAVLPSRLKQEMEALKEHILSGTDLSSDPLTADHAVWANSFISGRRSAGCEVTGENIDGVIREEIGRVFCRVLEDAGVYKRTAGGREAFMRFLNAAGVLS